MLLLDTNVLIHASRLRPPAVAQRLRTVSPDDVAISSITVAELWYGIEKSSDPARKTGLWRRLLEPYAVLPFDREAAELHGRLRFDLRHHPICERDLMIAAISLVGDRILVTNNTREFQRVRGLRVEDWTLP